MQIACAPLLPTGALGPIEYPFPPRGGNGGTAPTDYRCFDSEVITGLYLEMAGGNRQVEAVTLTCASTSTWQTHPVRAPAQNWAKPSNGGSGPHTCRSGEAVTGIGLRYGKHVNAIGAICNTYVVPPPAVASAPPPPPVAPPKPIKTTGKAKGSSGGGKQAESMVCQAGGGMTVTDANPGSSVFISFTPAAQGAGAAAPGPGECAWATRPVAADEARRLALTLSKTNAPLMVDAARNGGTFTVTATPIGSGFLMVGTIENVQVMGGVLSAGPVATPEPAPAPASSGGLTASTCGLSGPATVVIADPALTTLNVRDKPEGANILTKLPENSQVNVVGACGSTLSAGIVAAKVIPGWCAISSPLTGCVKEEFLVAGVSAQGGLPMGSAGIVANKPAQQEQAQTPPDTVTAPPPFVGAQVGGGQVAQLTQGANVRNEPSGSDKDKSGKKNVLGSLPGGSTVTVLECNNSWCRISHPQYPQGWVSRKFVQMTGVAVTVQIVPPATGFAPAPPNPAMPQDGGGLTASTCSLSGTATVVIPDPTLTTLNVRDRPNGPTILTKLPENSQVNVVGACGSTLSAGIVAPKVIPGWCAISSPLSGCVKEEFLVAGAGAPTGVPPGSAGLAAAQSSFAGTWSAEAQGSSYTFQLNQTGNSVTGNYTGSDGSNGQLNGNASGKVLRFSWSQTDGLSGAGKFTLSGDGNSFNGSYTLGNNPDVSEGSWNGRRQ